MLINYRTNRRATIMHASGSAFDFKRNDIPNDDMISLLTSRVSHVKFSPIRQGTLPNLLSSV